MRHVKVSSFLWMCKWVSSLEKFSNVSRHTLHIWVPLGDADCRDDTDWSAEIVDCFWTLLFFISLSKLVTLLKFCFWLISCEILWSEQKVWFASILLIICACDVCWCKPDVCFSFALLAISCCLPSCKLVVWFSQTSPAVSCLPKWMRLCDSNLLKSKNCFPQTSQINCLLASLDESDRLPSWHHMCRAKLPRRENCLLHTRQVIISSRLWILMWVFRSHRLVNDSLQTTHTYNISSVWPFKWISNSPLSQNSWLQHSHWYGPWSLWDILCRARVDKLGHFSSQRLQANRSPPEWRFKCSFSKSRCRNFSPHASHGNSCVPLWTCIWRMAFDRYLNRRLQTLQTSALSRRWMCIWFFNSLKLMNVWLHRVQTNVRAHVCTSKSSLHENCFSQNTHEYSCTTTFCSCFVQWHCKLRELSNCCLHTSWVNVGITPNTSLCESMWCFTLLNCKKRL